MLFFITALCLFSITILVIEYHLPNSPNKTLIVIRFLNITRLLVLAIVVKFSGLTELIKVAGDFL